MSATTRPGRGDRTTTRSATRIASGMLWVTITIVVAGRSQRRSSSRSNRSRVSASSALNGSSRSRTSGSRASARASADALARPARQLGRARSRRRPGRGRRARSSSASRARAPLGRPAGELERVGDVVGGRPPRQQPRLLEDEPDARVRAVDRVAVERDACRASGASRPAMTRRSVDLPQPFGPIRATIPPPGIVEVDAVEDRQRRRRRGVGNANDRSRSRSRRPAPAVGRAASARHERRPPPSGAQDRRGRRIEPT